MKRLASGIKLVAMRSGNAFDAVLVQGLVEQTTRSAIRIGNEHFPEPSTLGFNFGPHCGGDFLRRVVQFRGQTLELNMIPVVDIPDPHQFPGDRSASNDQNISRHGSPLFQRWLVRTQNQWLRKPPLPVLWPLRLQSPRPGNRRPRQSLRQIPRSAARHPPARCSRRGYRVLSSYR